MVFMPLKHPQNHITLARFRPKLPDCLREYSPGKFLADTMAGLTVGIVALSLCIGFGVASGATPQAGLYAGIIGGFLVSLLGGSRAQVGGPAGAFVGLLAVTGAQVGFANLLVCTMLAGAMLFAMGLFRMGALIKFVPQPVVAGFTCGIAITIILTQVKAFFGLSMEHDPAAFLPKVVALVSAAGTVSWATLALSLLLVAVMWKWPARLRRFAPPSIAVVVAGTALAWAAEMARARGLAGLDIATIGSAFGEIPRGLPAFELPRFDWRQINSLVMPAFTIAALGAIESLLSAVVADGLIDDRHDSNQELMGQGIANFVTPLFGGIAVTGVIARTATNIRSGAVTPVAGMVHAAFLLAALLVAAPLVSRIPLAALAVVLIFTGWRMGEWGEFSRIRKRARGDAAVFLATFALTVCFDLTVAVVFGMLLACAVFIKRVVETTQVQAVAGDERDAGQPGHRALDELPGPPPEGVVIYRVFGALLFGAADKLDMVLRRGMTDARVVIFHMMSVSALDATALDRLENLHAKMRQHRRFLILCGPHTQPLFLMEKAGFLDAVGRENVTADLPAAVERAKDLLEMRVAAGWTQPPLPMQPARRA